jgi:DNA-binding transcriptional ArsR family regulator
MEALTGAALTSSSLCAILKRMVQYPLEQRTSGQPPIDVVFHALSDANRRAMIDRLLDGPASVSELARPLAISLPAVVQHLHVLEASGVVRSHKVGRVRTCEIQPLALSTAERWISERRATWEARLDRLGEFLAGDTDESARSTRSKKARLKRRSE